MRQIVNALLLRDGHVLLARRSPTRRAYPDRWSFPGGHVEAGEALEQTLHRELQEELGISPQTYRAIEEIADPVAADTTYYLYAVTAWRGTPIIRDDEHTALTWFTLGSAAALDDLALEAYRPLFRRLADARL